MKIAIGRLNFWRGCVSQFKFYFAQPVNSLSFFSLSQRNIGSETAVFDLYFRNLTFIELHGRMLEQAEMMLTRSISKKAERTTRHMSLFKYVHLRNFLLLFFSFCSCVFHYIHIPFFFFFYLFQKILNKVFSF
jgi:hypothetical protein